MHSIDQTQTFLNAAFGHRRLDFARDIDDRVAVLRVHPEVFGVGFHVPTSYNCTWNLSKCNVWCMRGFICDIIVAD